MSGIYVDPAYVQIHELDEENLEDYVGWYSRDGKFKLGMIYSDFGESDPYWICTYMDDEGNIYSRTGQFPPEVLEFIKNKMEDLMEPRSLPVGTVFKEAGGFKIHNGSRWIEINRENFARSFAEGMVAQEIAVEASKILLRSENNPAKRMKAVVLQDLNDLS